MTDRPMTITAVAVGGAPSRVAILNRDPWAKQWTGSAAVDWLLRLSIAPGSGRERDMDGRHFDGLAKSMASGLTRRRALRVVLGATMATLAARISGSAAGVPACADEGVGCTLWARCCEGLVCTTLPLNPNAGVCRGGSGTTSPSSPPPSPPSKENPGDEEFLLSSLWTLLMAQTADR